MRRLRSIRSSLSRLAPNAAPIRADHEGDSVSPLRSRACPARLHAVARDNPPVTPPVRIRAWQPDLFASDDLFDPDPDPDPGTPSFDVMTAPAGQAQLMPRWVQLRLWSDDSPWTA